MKLSSIVLVIALSAEGGFAEDTVNCIEQERFEKSGKARFCLPAKDNWGFGAKAKRDQLAMEACIKELTPEPGNWGDDLKESPLHSPGDKIGYKDPQCVPGDLQELSGSGKSFFDCYEFSYKGSAIKTHAPGSGNARIKKTVKVSGQKIDGEVKFSGNVAYDPEDAVKIATKECERVGGKISITSTQAVAVDSLSNPRPLFATRAVCRGNFYYYDNTMDFRDQVEGLCDQEERKQLPKGVTANGCILDFDYDHPQISKEPQIAVHVVAHRKVSFKENDDLYKKWRCDRLASCQTKNAGASKESRDNFSDVCQLDSKWKEIVGVTADSSRSVGAAVADRQIKQSGDAGSLDRTDRADGAVGAASSAR